MLGRSLQKCSRLTTPVVQIRTASTGFNFDFSPEQLELRNTVRKFVANEVIPRAPQYDKTMEYPWDIIKKAHAQGLLNTEIPAEYGGLGLDMISSCIIHEEIAYGCSGIGTAVSGNGLAEAPLIIAANDDIKKRFLGRMIEEPLVASYAVTESIAGSDVGGTKTKAVKKGDEYILNGSKMWITNAGHANWFFVLARTAEDPKTPAGKAFTAFAVEGNSAGLVRGKKEINMGQRCSDTRGITFEDVRVPSANVVGAPGEGFKVAMKTFDKTRPLVASLACGVLARCLDESTKYSLERKTFGTQIANHQAIQMLLADTTVSLEMSRLMTYKCAYEADENRPGSYYASLAKLFASESANRAATNAVQIFGGAGFNSEYPVEKLMRDAKIFEIYEGTSQVQRMVIGRQLLGRVKETGFY